MSSEKAALPDASVYLNDDYFADVSTPKLDKHKKKESKAKEKKEKKEKKKPTEEKRRSSGSTLRDMFVKDPVKIDSPAPRRISQSAISPGQLAPVPVAVPSAPISVAASEKSGSHLGGRDAKKAPNSTATTTTTPTHHLHASSGASSLTASSGVTAPTKSSRSEGDASHIRQLVVKLESDRKTIQVGQPKGVAVERKYTGMSLADLSARDGRLVPVFLSDCVKWLWENGLREGGGLFIMEAPPERVSALITRVEKGLYSSLYEESGVDSALVTSVLKDFLRQLPDPVLSYALFDSFVEWGRDAASSVDTAAELLLRLPPSHLAVVKSILPLLHEVSTNKTTQMSAQDVSLALGAVLLRPADAANCKGFPGIAVSALEMLIDKWSAVAEAVSQLERRDLGSPISPQKSEGEVSMFAFLDELGMVRRYDTFKQLGLSVYDLQQMALREFLELGLDVEEAEKLHARLQKLASSPPRTSPAGAASAVAAETEEEWIDGELDPRVKKFLIGLGLDNLIELFEECQIDWVILDMSAVSDFKEIGLDDATVLKIMNGLGKDIAISSSAAPRPIGLNGGALELRSAVNDSDVKLDPKWILDLRAIRVQKKIGIGGYAEVWKALWKERTVAFKLLQEDTTDDARVVEEFRREMAVMSTLDHPNIVAFYGAVDHGRSLAMVLEYAARGDLEGILLDHKTPIPYLQRLRWAKQVAQGLQYLHTRNPRVIHRDIKSANILVDELLCTKICDFGLAKRKLLTELPGESNGINLKDARIMNVRSAAVQFTTLVGTPAWTAPELIANRSYTEKVDVYSFSVFLWELMCRQTPHEGLPHFELAYEILAHNLRPEIFDFIPETFKQLMQSCWASKAEYRPQIDVVLKILTAMLSQPRHDEVKLPF